MRRVFLLFVVMLLTVSSDAVAQEQKKWELILEHDSTGRVQFGSKQLLLQAVREGARVRIGFHIPFRNKLIEHVFPAEHMTIFDNELYVQCLPMTSQRWNHPQLTLWFGEKPFTYYLLCGTTGECDEMAVEWEHGNKLLHLASRKNLQWFVEKR